MTKYDNKLSDKRYPKNCKHLDQCRYRTRCFYNYQIADVVCNEGSVKHITEDIAKLKDKDLTEVKHYIREEKLKGRQQNG